MFHTSLHRVVMGVSSVPVQGAICLYQRKELCRIHLKIRGMTTQEFGFGFRPYFLLFECANVFLVASPLPRSPLPPHWAAY